MRTLKFIRSAIRSRLGEPLPRDGGFTDQELLQTINLGQFDVARRLLRIDQDWFTTYETIVTTSGIITYDLPSDLLYPIALTWNGRKMNKLSPEDLGVIESNLNYTPSLNNSYYLRTGSEIVIYPTPGVQTAGILPLIYVYYIQKPTELEDDTDETIIESQYVDLIIQYGVMRCAPKLGKGDAGLLEKQYDETFRELEEQYIKFKLTKEKLPGESNG